VTSAIVNGAYFRRLVRPVEVTVEADGDAWSHRVYVAVGAGTVDDVGFRFRPFFRSLTEPGRIHAVGVACPAPQLVLELPRIWRARPTRHPDIHSVTVTRLVLRGDAPLSYMIDGDLHRGGREIRIGVGPEVRFLLP
jgi:diacylglycerol kinase family enzyme